MDKSSLLKLIAESGYNVGFGAKKHFATYDIVEKAPGWIGLISIAVGIFALIFDELAGKEISATLTVAGIAGMYISFYADKKDQYSDVGNQLTQTFNSLKALYYRVKGSQKTDFSEELKELGQIEESFYKICLKKQIFLSDWYAHYKFFWQHQIEWMAEQRNFTFWRDKIPLSAYIFIFSAILITGVRAAPHMHLLISSLSCR